MVPTPLDVSAIMGIRSNGQSLPFSKACYSGDVIQRALIDELLGQPNLTVSAQAIAYKDIISECAGWIPQDRVEEEQYARFFVLYLMGAILFPNGKEGCHLCLLPILVDLDLSIYILLLNY